MPLVGYVIKNFYAAEMLSFLTVFAGVNRRFSALLIKLIETHNGKDSFDIWHYRAGRFFSSNNSAKKEPSCPVMPDIKAVFAIMSLD